MFLVVRLLIVASIGAGAGLWSVWFALTDPRFDVTTHVGVWRVLREAADPYAAARAARAGALPLGAAEGVAFVAVSDLAGRLLDPRCHYVVEGRVADVSLWTLTVTDRAGRTPVNPAGRIGFTNRDVVREADGRVVVTVGPTARPGNFVPAAGLDSLVLTLRLYSPAVTVDLPAAEDMPRVRLVGCTMTGGVL